MRLALIVACALLIGAPAVAAEPRTPEPGFAFRVAGVAADDTLNVRDQAGTAGDIVATLAPDARGVAVTGATRMVGTTRWWEILHAAGPRGTGWVAARFLEVADTQAMPDTGFPLRCAGTEPFWSVIIKGEAARYSTADGARAEWRAGARRDAHGYRPGHRFAVRLDADRRTEPGWIAISRAATACSDGMSEIDYPYDMILVMPGAAGGEDDGRVRAGCCVRVP